MLLNWFNLSFHLKNLPLQKAKRCFSEILEVSKKEYKSYVDQQKQTILDYHFNNNPYYKSLCKGHKPKKWADVPVVTKQDLQQPLKKRLSTGFSKKQVYVNKTSGSSGHPFTFAKDDFCHALTWASIINKFGWYGIDFNHSFQARFYGIPLNKIGYYKERFKDVLARRYRFPIFNLNDSSFESYLKIFNKKKFDHINGYTSVLVLFAKFLRRKKIILKDICPSLKVCMATSEMLFEDDKILLKRQFGIPIVNEYGASELGLIAFQNPNGDWQLNTETLFVEVLDTKNNPVLNGETGRLVITSLYNKAHPFIRYEIGDVGALSENSTSKKSFLKELVGRKNDVAKLSSGKVVPGLTFYYVTKSIIEDAGNVQEFIIKQTDLSSFRIEFTSKKPLDTKYVAKIKDAMNRYLEKDLNLELKRVEHLERSKSGKLKQFERLF